jgi:hypothetical protein
MTKLVKYVVMLKAFHLFSAEENGVHHGLELLANNYHTRSSDERKDHLSSYDVDLHFLGDEEQNCYLDPKDNAEKDQYNNSQTIRSTEDIYSIPNPQVGNINIGATVINDIRFFHGQQRENCNSDFVEDVPSMDKRNFIVANEENVQLNTIANIHDHTAVDEELNLAGQIEPVGKHLWLPFKQQQMLIEADSRKISSSSGIDFINTTHS